MRILTSLVLTLFVSGVVGCSGDNGPQRFAVRGIVTFSNGDPVEAAELQFTPDKSQKNAGPATFGVVKNGLFSIPAEVGAVEGASVVLVKMFDSNEKSLGSATFNVTVSPNEDENDFSLTAPESVSSTAKEKRRRNPLDEDDSVVD